MTTEEFEANVLNSNITNFEPYFKKATSHEEQLELMIKRAVLAKHGLCIEQCLDADGPFAMAILIQNNHCKERYDDWKTYPSFLVQGALIDKGLYLDYFNQSTDPNIQEAIQEYKKGQLNEQPHL